MIQSQVLKPTIIDASPGSLSPKLKASDSVSRSHGLSDFNSEASSELLVGVLLPVVGVGFALPGVPVQPAVNAESPIKVEMTMRFMTSRRTS
ncbi:hypothetical protein GCM10010178_13360 [Lentzea flava]|uniref:Uncharacterized protein n=1 Tax=Lentzea flava TaxID=103732 RepID=A0ABQ2UCP2_9PSEU|nr:hypothetical protein GCM10010178_13360 [Lentzea flava]